MFRTDSFRFLHQILGLTPFGFNGLNLVCGTNSKRAYKSHQISKVDVSFNLDHRILLCLSLIG
jgi:hypothetical protein